MVDDRGRPGHATGGFSQQGRYKLKLLCVRTGDPPLLAPLRPPHDKARTREGAKCRGACSDADTAMQEAAQKQQHRRLLRSMQRGAELYWLERRSRIVMRERQGKLAMFITKTNHTGV
eukprot:398212-Hanusia_phi.AAC.1